MADEEDEGSLLEEATEATETFVLYLVGGQDKVLIAECGEKLADIG